jgi:hypothetical protein
MSNVVENPTCLTSPLPGTTSPRSHFSLSNATGLHYVYGKKQAVMESVTLLPVTIIIRILIYEQLFFALEQFTAAPLKHEVAKSGAYVRTESPCRDIISADHPVYKPEKGRYHLYGELFEVLLSSTRNTSPPWPLKFLFSLGRL